MLTWLRKKLGYHVCEEFTQWEVREVVARRRATADESLFHNIAAVKVRMRFQERRCTTCGKIEQRKLEC